MNNAIKITTTMLKSIIIHFDTETILKKTFKLIFSNRRQII